MRMSSATNLLILLTVLVVLVPTHTYAFGAGDIPDFAYLNDKAFRHGDIENVLETLAKTAGRAGGGGLLGFATSMLQEATGGTKFSKMDIKRVYFGNWLRDYSQAMDIAGLSKLSGDTIVMLISVLGFMTFGLATEEFQVTPERLSVYLPVEHIDNPKGYAEKEGDARQFHQKLRPPVSDRELEIDERTGMKNYMASEGQGWDTSTGHIRRTFEKCIEMGRRARGNEGADLWEAYRLLGTGLHTLEDLLAHSNWCELALRKMGHQEVFCHVGDDVLVDTPNGSAPPLITGTFGSADFIHSLMGEATDHLSEASVTNLYDKMNKAGNADNSFDGLRDILGKLPSGGGDDQVQRAEEIKSKAYDLDPDKLAPEDVQKQLWEVLVWHDNVYRDVVKKIEMIPGLSDLMDEFTEALNAYVYTILAPWLTPIVQQATGVLNEGSAAVIESDDQFAVFNDPRASDPSHSMLSKDHFGLILNEPAGKIAKLVVVHTVQLMVNAWFDEGQDARQVIDQILETFHHPYYATGDSQIQNQMYDEMTRWLGGMGESESRQVLENLTKESVRNGKNKRSGDGEEGGTTGGGSYGQAHSQNRPHGQQGGYGGGANRGQQQTGYGGGNTYGQQQGGYGGGDSYNQQQSGYGGGDNYDQRQRGEETSYSRRNDEDNSYSRRDEDNSYSRRNEGGYGRSGDDEGYGGRTETYGSSNDTYGSSGRQYGNRDDDDSNRHRRNNDEDEPRYGQRRDDDDSNNRSDRYGDSQRESRGYQPSYQPSYEQPSYGSSEGRGYGDNNEGQQGYGAGGHSGYGGRRSGDNDDEGYGRRRGGDNEESGGYGRTGYGQDETFGAERLNLGGQEESYGRRNRGDNYYE